MRTQGFGTAGFGFALCLLFGADNRLGGFFGQRSQFGFALLGTLSGFVFFGRLWFGGYCRIGFRTGRRSGLRLRCLGYRRAFGLGCGGTGFEFGCFGRGGFGRSAAGGFGCLKFGIRSFYWRGHRLCDCHGFNCCRRRFNHRCGRCRSRCFDTLFRWHRNHAAATAGFHLYAAHFAVLGGFFAAQGNGAAAV